MDQTVIAMCAAGIALLVISMSAGRKEIAGARGLEKIVALSGVCFSVPLAVFGALHLFGSRFLIDLVPEYLPWRLFWVYFFGTALIAASLSIATSHWVRWSGFLFGITMFLFVAMIHLPGAFSEPNDRFIWTIVIREMSFGGAGWILAGNAEKGWTAAGKNTLMIVGRVFVTVALIFFGIQHFLHPTGVPGVPLRKEMPTWVPGGMLVDYLTGAAFLVAGGSILLRKKTRTVATWLGSWIVLMVLVIYGPILVLALSSPDTGTQLEGVNYFADTLLFAGAILVLAKASPADPI